MRFSPTLLKQIGLAVAGQALPDKAVMDDILTDFRKSLVAAIVSGVMAAAFLLVCCYGFFLYLMAEGLAQTTSLVVSAGLLLLVSVICGLIARNRSNRLIEAKDSLGVFPESKNSGLLEQVIAAFIEGICIEDTKKTSKYEPASSGSAQEDTTHDRIILVKE